MLHKISLVISSIIFFSTSVFAQFGVPTGSTKINYYEPAFLSGPTRMGEAATYLDDANANGINEIIFGDNTYSGTATYQGALWVSYLNTQLYADSVIRITEAEMNLPTPLDSGDFFGRTLINLGDVDGNGYTDLAVSAPGDDDAGLDSGAVYILFFDSAATVINSTKISNAFGAFNGLFNGSKIGRNIGAGGDLNNDGTPDLLIGLPNDQDGGGINRGALLIVFLNPNGTIQNIKKLSDGNNGLTQPDNHIQFGFSAAGIGDINNDGFNDIVVGAPNANYGGSGAVMIVNLTDSGTVINQQLISGLHGNFTGTGGQFGYSVAGLGDINNDNVPDIAVGAVQNNGTGKMYTITLNQFGYVLSNNLLGPNGSSQLYNTYVLDNNDFYGSWISPVGDLNNDGQTDIVVSSLYDDDGYSINSGAHYVTLIDTLGNTLYRSQKLSFYYGGIPTGLADYEEFGTDISPLGDVDGNGTEDYIVGAPESLDGNDNNATREGAAYVLLTNPDGSILKHEKISLSAYPSLFSQNGMFGTAVCGIGDLNGDGVPDAAVGAPFTNSNGVRAGAVYILFLKSDGSVLYKKELSTSANTLPFTINAYYNFGNAIANLGDINGDGVTDIAIAAYNDGYNTSNNTSQGAVYVCHLNTTGTIISYYKIGQGTPNFTYSSSSLGNNIGALGDIDHDGVNDLVIGYNGSFTSNVKMELILLNSNGSVKQQSTISPFNIAGTGITINFVKASFASGYDINLDGTNDLLVGLPDDRKAYIFFLTPQATISGYQLINPASIGISLNSGSDYGNAVCFGQNRNNNGTPEALICDFLDDDGLGYSDFGAFYYTYLNAPFMAYAGNAVTSCDSIQLNHPVAAQGGTMPYTYSWSPGYVFNDSTVANPIAYSDSLITVTLTVTDSTGATATSSTTINGSPLQLNYSLLTPVYCSNDSTASVQLQATGIVGTSLFELNGDTSSIGLFTNLPAGNYTAEVSDSSSCTQTISIQIAQPDTIAISANQTASIACANDSTAAVQIAAMGGTAPYTYINTSLLDTNTLGSFTNLPANNYQFLIHDTFGCISDTLNITISQPQNLVVNATATNPLCVLETNGTIAYSFSGGTGNSTATLQPTGVATPGMFSQLGSGVYTLTLTDSAGCTADTSILLVSPNPIVATSNIAIPIICNGDNSGVVSINAQGGTGALSYSLNNQTFVSNNQFSQLSAGNYTVYIQDVNACLDSIQFTLTNPPVLGGTTNLNQAIACFNDASGAFEVNAFGGVQPFEYGLNTLFFQSSNVFTNKAAGSYNTFVKDANGCVQASGSITLLNANQITISANAVGESPAGNDGQITVVANGGAGGFSYSLDQSNYQSSPIFNGLQGGLYTVYVKDANDCIESYQVFIDSAVGIVSNLAISSTIKVYPNPAQFNQSVHIENSGNSPINLVISNLLGETVLELCAKSNQTTTVNTQFLQPGMYLISDEKSSLITKLIVY